MSDEVLNNSRPEDSSNEETHSDETVTQSELKSILSDPEIPEAKRKKIEKVFHGIIVHKSSSFIGPIPPPEILKGYSEIIPNGGERILNMAERQSNHRIQIEDHVIREQLRQSHWGQIFGFSLGIIGMGLATLLAILGHEVVAGIFASTTIIGLVTVFVIGKKAQKQDLSEKE